MSGGPDKVLVEPADDAVVAVSAAEIASPLRQPAFRLFWCVRVMTSLGFQMNAVAVGWQVYALTGSTFALGMVGLAQFVPMVLLTLPAGHIADRFDRRLVMRCCEATIACGAALLAASTLFAGHLGGHAVGMIYAAVVLIGGARSIESPCQSALLPSLVGVRALAQATAVSSSAQQAASIVGPAIGGLLYAVSPAATYAVVVVAYATAATLVGFIRLSRPAQHRQPATLRSVFSGVGFIRRRPTILGSISLDLFAVLFGGATAMLPVYAQTILRTGPWGLGLLRAAPAVGALAMSGMLARFPLRRHAGMRMFAAVIVFGAGTVVFALSRSIVLSLLALAVIGAADVISVVVRLALVQVSTPDAMRGRVSAVNMLFIGTSNQLGEFESGMAATLLGTAPSVALGGMGTIAVALVWMGLFPGLRRVDRLEDGISK